MIRLSLEHAWTRSSLPADTTGAHTGPVPGSGSRSQTGSGLSSAYPMSSQHCSVRCCCHAHALQHIAEHSRHSQSPSEISSQ